MFALGIKPGDKLAQEYGIECHPTGSIVVDDNLQLGPRMCMRSWECVRQSIAPGSTFFSFHVFVSII